jgi:gliding-associated putative ABC transporter substrate-binding component GldG
MAVKDKIRSQSWTEFLFTAAAIIFVALAGSLIRFRIDLTEDKRFTLSTPTRDILGRLETDVYIEVYLDGEIPVPLKRLKRSVREILDEFRIVSGRRIDYAFINPAEAKDAQHRESRYRELYDKGLIPVNIQAGDNEGGRTQKYIFPGMIINYNGIEMPLNFLKNNQALSSEQNILHSIEGLEYEMIQTISTITADTIYKVAFLEGHGEYSEIEVADITLHLAKYFTVDRGSIGGKPGVLDNYAAVIVAGPSKEFSEADKLVLDQYIMNGGKVLWMLEQVRVNSDSLVYGQTVGLYHPLNVEDMLFRYGVRINPEIVQDMESWLITLSVSTGAEQKQIVPAPWPYYPLLTPNHTHPVTRNLNKVWGRYVNPIDTVGLDPAIRKTPLLTSSAFSRTLTPPMVIRLKEVDQAADVKLFNRGALTIAVLLEGSFTSAFRNRMTGTLVDDRSFRLKTSGDKTKMIVVADGDIIRNEIRVAGRTTEPLPLGQDKYSGQMFGNRDFLINCINYLVDDNGLMELRSREIKLRLLDRSRIKNEKVLWQVINTGGPILLVILAGLIYGALRRKLFSE